MFNSPNQAHNSNYQKKDATCYYATNYWQTSGQICSFSIGGNSNQDETDQLKLQCLTLKIRIDNQLYVNLLCKGCWEQ